MAAIGLVGAADFVGQAVLQRLVAQGDQVTAIVFADTDAAILAQLCEQNRALQGKVQIVRVARDAGSIAPHQLVEVFAPLSSVICCADTQRGRCFEDFLPNNVATLASVIDTMQQFPEKPLLHFSSLAALRPDISWYARSKAAAELLLIQQLRANAARGIRLNWTIARLPAVYGPGASELNPLLQSLRRGFVPIPGSMDQRFSLLHVSDLTEAVVAWLGNPRACAGEAFALDDGHIVGYDWGQIAQAASPGAHRLIPIPAWVLQLTANANLTFATWFKYAPLLTPGKVRELKASDWVSDSSDFSLATGWQPRIDLATGMRELFAAKPDLAAAIIT